MLVIQIKAQIQIWRRSLKIGGIFIFITEIVSRSSIKLINKIIKPKIKIITNFFNDKSKNNEESSRKFVNKTIPSQ